MSVEERLQLRVGPAAYLMSVIDLYSKELRNTYQKSSLSQSDTIPRQSPNCLSSSS